MRSYLDQCAQNGVVPSNLHSSVCPQRKDKSFIGDRRKSFMQVIFVYLLEKSSFIRKLCTDFIGGPDFYVNFHLLFRGWAEGELEKNLLAASFADTSMPMFPTDMHLQSYWFEKMREDIVIFVQRQQVCRINYFCVD